MVRPVFCRPPAGAIRPLYCIYRKRPSHEQTTARVHRDPSRLPSFDAVRRREETQHRLRPRGRSAQHFAGLCRTSVRKEDLDTSFPTLLRQSGYKTGFYSKQHVNWEKGVDGMTTMFDDHEVLRRSPYLKKMPDGSSQCVGEVGKYTAFSRSSGQRRQNLPFAVSRFSVLR